MTHPIERAARDAGFIQASPATAHPLDLWREKLDGLPLGKRLVMEHRPEAICGRPAGETTVWAALYRTPPFKCWPEGHGEISGYYMSSPIARDSVEHWAKAVEELGYEVMSRPPLPARAIAIRAGLGVHGLNGPLISKHGSFVHIGVLLVRARPPEGTPGPEADQSPGCERCGRCIAACPTGAVSENGVDALKCLRYDMGYPEHMPDTHYELMGNRLMGCDTCQLACPHNAPAESVVPQRRQTEPFELERLLASPDLEAIAKLIGKNYARKGRLQFQAALAAANTGRTDLAHELRRHLESDYEPLKKAAAWAITRLEE